MDKQQRLHLIRKFEEVMPGVERYVRSRRYTLRLKNDNLDDLLQSVRLKVWESIPKCFPNVNLENFCIEAAKWAIQQYQRDGDPLTKHYRRKVRKFKKAEEEFESMGFRGEALTAKLCEELKITPFKLLELRSLSRCKPLRIHDMEDRLATPEGDMSSRWGIPPDSIGYETPRDTVERVTAFLTVDEKGFIEQHYLEGKTLTEMAVADGRSLSVMSRRKKDLLEKMRREHGIKTRIVN